MLISGTLEAFKSSSENNTVTSELLNKCKLFFYNDNRYDINTNTTNKSINAQNNFNTNYDFNNVKYDYSCSKIKDENMGKIVSKNFINKNNHNHNHNYNNRGLKSTYNETQQIDQNVKNISIYGN